MSPAPKTSWVGRLPEIIFSVIVGGAIILLVAIMVFTAYKQAQNISKDPKINWVSSTDQAADPNAQDIRNAAEQALRESDRTSDSLGLLLSLLQGGAVLVGLALGAVAFFGLRSYTRLNEDLTNNLATINQNNLEFAEWRKTFAAWIQAFNKMEEERDALSAKLTALEEQRERYAIEGRVSVELMEAYQDYNLKNYRQAYNTVQSLLKESPDNPHVLYLAGWLETQHIDHQLTTGVQHLRQALEQRPNWFAAQAAYGVALRRQAREFKNAEPGLKQALDKLQSALKGDFYLQDLKQESFWTTVAGIHRELNELDDAIEAFQKALKVTPYSSYPLGNLATLYLQKASTLQGEERDTWINRAQTTYEKTHQYAKQETLKNPNEYYQIMDIAMARVMLSHVDPTHLESAFDALKTALEIGEATKPMLEVSLVGWTNMDTFCPAEWGDIKPHLAKAIRLTKEAIAEKEAQQKEEEQPPTG